MAVDPALTVQQHDNVPVSEILGTTAKFSVVLAGLDMIGANADTAYYVYRGDAGTLDAVDLVLGGTLSADATVTVAINGTPVPGTNMPAGVLTVPSAGSGAGVLTSGTPTSANALADGDIVSLLVGGTNITATFADVSLAISYVPAAT